MADKKSLPAPIDRPLSRAYLREFTGWSTAYPPGLSDPTSLRLMENIFITREGAAAIRPGLRSVLTKDVFLNTNFGITLVGSFEHFYTNDGRKALLFATRETDDSVFFRAALYNSSTQRFDVKSLTDVGLAFDIPQGQATLSFSADTTYVRYVQIDNKIFAMSNAGEPIRIFWVGNEKKARKIVGLTRPSWSSDDKLSVRHPDAAWINTASKKTNGLTSETPTASTLVSSDATKNTYNYGYFYTFSNEIGESAPSQITVIKAARSFGSWRMLAPDGSGNPTTTTVTNAAMAMDQLVAIISESVYNAARAEGALAWNLYGIMWSDQSAVPAEGILIATTPVEGTGENAKRWCAHTPLIEGQEVSMALPNEQNRYNYSEPSTAGQGLVTGDRIVLVYDKNNAAVIRWSSNQQGEYINFSASMGGGYKTLTSGNLFVPACVKLWQNPQSVDTITVLCTGVDGYSTSYYMSPSTTVSGNSLSTTIMGFEETTATPGTVSPYGVEVLNNALYHPVDSELTKSTASNYNINHKPMTDKIQNKWVELLHKENIISSQLDNRLYYIVHNPDGEPLEKDCMGNEVWVCDTATEGTWSRWLVQGLALQKLEVGGHLYMSLSRPDGLFVFDDKLDHDETASSSGTTVERAIDWMLETNTQGANRAHDAWAHLQQMNITVGNFQGAMRYGIRGLDKHGKRVDVSKVFRDLNPVDRAQRPMPFDIDDFLLIRRDLKEWFFYASSYEKGGVVQPSFGQISLVQYRYTPVTVNIGYEYGSVETFEYTRATVNWDDRTTDTGVPQPYVDTGRP